MDAEALEDLHWDCAGDDMPQGNDCWLCAHWRGASPLRPWTWGVCGLRECDAQACGSCGDWDDMDGWDEDEPEWT